LAIRLKAYVFNRYASDQQKPQDIEVDPEIQRGFKINNLQHFIPIDCT
jgi:hypothetical protein